MIVCLIKGTVEDESFSLAIGPVRCQVLTLWFGKTIEF